MKYELPNNIAENASSILDSAPDVIYQLEDHLGEILNAIDHKSALLAIKYKDEKQAVARAMARSDEEIVSLDKSKAETEAMLNLWKNAQTNARAFYKAQTQG